MRLIQLVLLASILVVLGVIALELHRVSNELQLVGDVRSALVLAAHRPQETREQRRARLQERLRRAVQDAEDMWDTPNTPAAKTPTK